MRKTLKLGENFVPLNADDTVSLDSPVRCSYEPCSREIPDNSSVLRAEDNVFYCSHACQMFDVALMGRTVLAILTRVRYSFDAAKRS